MDTLPIPEQHLGSAWGELPCSKEHFDTNTEALEASRMLGLGHLLGYVAGTLDLLKYFGHFLGDSQFKQLCIIAGAAIVFSNGITSYCVQERVLLSRPLVYLHLYQKRANLSTGPTRRARERFTCCQI